MKESIYHVLLIGIDAYARKPLHGCVNDIDTVQAILMERAGIPGTSITRLASPHPAEAHPATVPSAPATLANIRKALEGLAASTICSTDRIFIYYSGHGARVPVLTAGGRFDRESMVPVDYDSGGKIQLLLDYELNRYLAAIALRTPNMTFILDCCHSAGVTRDLPPKARARFMDWKTDFKQTAPFELTEDLGALTRGIGVDPKASQSIESGSVDDCQVVAACLNHELAQEVPGEDGKSHGLLTSVLARELAQIADSDLRSLPWVRFWGKVSEQVSAQNPDQHPWMAGSAGRIWLAGPPVQRDAGFTVEKNNDNTYSIGAGLLAGVTEKARIGVYASTPPYFARLDSAEDLATRKGLLLITSVSLSRSIAVTEGAPFELPVEPRARLVAPGPAERLRCAVNPSNPAIEAQIKASKVLQLVGVGNAEVRVENRDGAWTLTDDVQGAKPGSPVLITLEPGHLNKVQALLEHYYDYARPLRMASRCNDLQGVLQVSLLASPSAVAPADAQSPNLAEVGSKGGFAYSLQFKDKFCVRVRNTSMERLRVTLLNCAATGRVEYLGDQEIDPRKQYVFWRSNEQGKPFIASTGKPGPYIDRYVIIGRTDLGAELDFLRVDPRFSEILDPLREAGATKETGDEDGTDYRWTATQVVVSVGL